MHKFRENDFSLKRIDSICRKIIIHDGVQPGRAKKNLQAISRKYYMIEIVYTKAKMSVSFIRNSLNGKLGNKLATVKYKN